MTSESTPADRLDALVDRHPLATWRLLAWPVMALLTILVIWASFTELEEVAVATGEVVPQGKVKVIQHLEGGIIKSIHVSEGATVRAGDPLVQLDLATGGVNRAELQAQLDGELLRRARLIAEAEGTDLILPPEPAERHPTLAEAEQRAFHAHRQELDSNLNVLREQLLQRQLEVEELQARKQAVSRNLNLARQRLAMSSDLLAEGLTPKMDHLQLRSEVESLSGELESLTPAMPRARAAVAETENRVTEAEVRFRVEAQEELGEAQQTIARVDERLAEATRQDVRAEIKSPIDGIVKRLRYNTIGGVVAPGEPIMEIVPTGDTLVVEARLNPTDRGYVSEGQPASVKISTYDFVRYGSLDGTVTHVAPDSSADGDGNPYFRVIVQTDRTHLGAEQGALPIMPGMQAVVDIHTGKKSVLEYLIKPVLKLRHEAFRER